MEEKWGKLNTGRSERQVVTSGLFDAVQKKELIHLALKLPPAVKQTQRMGWSYSEHHEGFVLHLVSHCFFSSVMLET